MKQIIYPGILLVALMFTGCVNLKPKADTVQHYVLGPIGPTSHAGVDQAESAREAAIYVGRPDLPGYLEGNRLQYRTETGAVQTLPDARWGEPIQEGVARALSEYLVRGGHYAQGAFYPWPVQSAEVPRLRLRLHQFTATADGRILMDATWQMAKPGGGTVVGRWNSSEFTWEPGNAESLVLGLNRCLEGLADAIGRNAAAN